MAVEKEHTAAANGKRAAADDALEKSAEDKAADEMVSETQEEQSSDEEFAAEEQKLLQLQERIVVLEEEQTELKNQLLRKQADFDNFRKRMFREKDEAIRYANTGLLNDLVAVIDDFERAIGSAESSTDFESFLSGIKLIEKQFVGMLERNWGLKRMETVGKEFDPQEHEALMMEECDGCSTQTVVEDYQKGYFLHDRVLRHAKVKVGVPKAAEEAEEKAEEDN